MRLELEDVGVYESKQLSGHPVTLSEKMTQTEPEILDLLDRQNASPCNHPSLTCQELLALSTAFSTALTAQIAFDAKHLKHCSTYNLAEGVDGNKKKGIYQVCRNLLWVLFCRLPNLLLYTISSNFNFLLQFPTITASVMVSVL